MASPSTMASPSSYSLPPPPLPSFTSDKEGDGEKEERHEQVKFKDLPRVESHIPTPLHSGSSLRPPRPKTGQAGNEVGTVSCNKCRPTSRDKLIVPLDPSATSFPSPGGLLRSLFFPFTRHTPATAAAAAAGDFRDDRWRLVAAELSRKILHVTRKRDEALQEASRLKNSLAELEHKVDLLESNIRSISSRPVQPVAFPSQAFRFAVEDARTAMRHFARLLIAHIRPVKRSMDRFTGLIQPLDPRAVAEWRRNPGWLLVYTEALLNRIFYSRLEEGDDEESGLIDPVARCESNRAAYEAARELSWEDVLSKGTRHYSEGLSRFCDLKMSEVVGTVGWTTPAQAPWPEGLLLAFFMAAKGAWVVRLMTRSVHPAVPALRAERGARFDERFMEDVARDRVRRATPVSVREVVAPGFDLYMVPHGILKCKVVCVYYSNSKEWSNDHIDTVKGDSFASSTPVNSSLELHGGTKL
ncbi:IRK-interacting protein-like isoform X2 [Zingiber officinale]|uniref:IRK-interacting protein-like isoform X2 n=1 Tax=Zingiber officinale TaxID=94328 RepID=UPI001C4B344F|nr:IRK-interacting protein-like isoform X2 [Zingiber officinale]